MSAPSFRHCHQSGPLPPPDALKLTLKVTLLVWLRGWTKITGMDGSTVNGTPLVSLSPAQVVMRMGAVTAPTGTLTIQPLVELPRGRVGMSPNHIPPGGYHSPEFVRRQRLMLRMVTVEPMPPLSGVKLVMNTAVFVSARTTRPSTL